VLGVPYLAVRELNIATAASHTDPAASLADFRTAHSLNPLMSDPGILGGIVALINGRDFQASGLFRQGLSREPGDWVGWLGRGLAASAQGEVAAARRSYVIARHLNTHQVVVQNALRQVNTKHPLNVTQALQQIDYLP
jgi:Flp pilus assembly protein TadD